jgi:hypothetical protein
MKKLDEINSLNNGEYIKDRSDDIKKELMDLLNDYYMDESKIKLLKELGFSQETIFNKYREIKKLFELVYNYMSIEFIDFDTLKLLIRNNNWDLNKIKKELKEILPIDNYSFKEQSFLISILDE